MRNIRGVLTDAFNRGSLCALHIDLQRAFYISQKYNAYKNAHDFADQLRSRRTRNYWVVYTDSSINPIEAKEAKIFLARETIMDEKFKYPNRIPDDEIVLPKRAANLFFEKSGYMLKYLRQQGMDTFLFRGVNAHECVAESFYGLFDSAKTLGIDVNAIVIPDCTNIDGDRGEYFTHNTRVLARIPIQPDSFFMAGSKEVLEILDAAKDASHSAQIPTASQSYQPQPYMA